MTLFSVRLKKVFTDSGSFRYRKQLLVVNPELRGDHFINNIAGEVQSPADSWVPIRPG